MDGEKWSILMKKAKMFIKVHGAMDKDLDKVNTDFQMEIFIKDFG